MKKLSISLVSAIGFSLLASYYSEAQIITTIAGSAPPTNVQATSMGMEIFGTVADKHGNIYISDVSNSVVRKVNLSTGIATIIAGIGNYGPSGDGGLAINAGLAYPQELGMDTAGNLYIGDGATIRKITISTGIITTVVGDGNYGYSGDNGPAILAEIEGEVSMGFDKHNNMYIADFVNNRVREVNAKTGIITTIAGTGTGGYNGDNILANTAQLYYPSGVCADDSGNIYIAEQSNSRIRKINWKTGIITTIAGDGGFGYNADNIAAITAELWAPLSVELDKAGNLYIADWGNARVREINAKTGIITTIAGDGIIGHSGDGGLAIAAELSNAFGVALDTLNNVYVVEGFNPVIGYNAWIRKVDAVSHNISTMAGNGDGNYTGDGISATSAQLSTPSTVQVDAAGNVYVADWGNNRIRKINGSGVISTYAGDSHWGFWDNVLADSGELFAPNDIALDKKGNMYIVDQYNDRIRKIDLNDSITTFAGDGANAPYGGSFYGDSGIASIAEFYYPSGIAMDDSGNVFIADYINQRIREINWKTDIITTVAGNGTGGYNGDGILATAAELYFPVEVSVDDSDNLYIADAANNRIREVSRATGMISTLAGNGNGGFSGDGNAAASAELNFPEGVAVDKYGVVYISDAGNNRVRIVNPSTHIISTIAGNGNGGFSGDGGLATSAELDYPENVSFDAAGNMYIADNGNNRIRKVSGIVGLGVGKVSMATTPIKVYPNPGNGNFTLTMASETNQSSLNIEVYNVLGEQVYSSGYQPSAISYQPLSVDLSSQPNGVYLYKVITESGEIIGQGKMVIQK